LGRPARALCGRYDVRGREQFGLFGPHAGNDLVDDRVVEYALAFAEPTIVRVYPARFCDDPPCNMSRATCL
jgi:hypothetical protein